MKDFVQKSMYNVECYLLPYLLLKCPGASDGKGEEYKELHFLLSCLWQYAEVRPMIEKR